MVDGLYFDNRRKLDDQFFNSLVDFRKQYYLPQPYAAMLVMKVFPASPKKNLIIYEF